MKDDDSLDSLMRRQFGVVSRAQLIARGLSADAIRWNLKRELWLPTSIRGVYRGASAPDSWSQRAMSACLAAEDAVLSHASAAFVWHLDGFKQPRVLDLSSTERHIRSEPGVCWHEANLDARQRFVRNGLPVTHLPRTLVDVMGIVEPNRAEIAVESALRQYPEMRGWLVTEFERYATRGFVGSRRLRELVTFAGPVRESPLEVIVEQLLIGAGLPAPVRQFRVFNQRRLIARLDLAYPAIKLGIQAHGYGFHHGHEPFERDLRQGSQLAALGWRLLTPTWQRVTKEADEFVEEARSAYLHALADKPDSPDGAH